MDYAVTKSRYTHKTNQKNLFCALLCGSLGLNVLQVMERMTVTEKVIILPPNIQKEVWIKGNAVSDGYLEEWALYVSNLLLNVSKHTIDYQSELVLRHVSPEFSGRLHMQFKRDAENLTKNNATTHFLPKEIVVDSTHLTARVTGLFTTYVGKEQVSSHEHTYELKFIFNKGRFLQLIQFKQLNKDSAGDDEMDRDEAALNQQSSNVSEGTKR